MNSPGVIPEVDDHCPWQIDQVIEGAHSQAIYDIETIGNHMYTTSKMKMKVWDLNTLQKISEISAHKGFINCVKAATAG